MKIIRMIKSLFFHNPFLLFRVMSDWKSLLRLHFLYAAMDFGLLEILLTPISKDDLIENPKIKRPELLEGLLDVGVALKELSYKNGLYRLKGRRSKALVDKKNDAAAAFIQANVTYYNSVYRNFSERLYGAPLGNYLDDYGEIVSRLSVLPEPFVVNFIRDTVSGNKPIRMLEVGCGSGVYIRNAIEANEKVTGIGIDMDKKVVAQINDNLNEWGIGNHFKVVAGDIRYPPSDITGVFDLITLYSVIYYFSIEERSALFKYLRSIISPDGTIAIVSNMQSHGRDLVAANLNMGTSSMIGCTPLPSLTELTAQLKECGFCQVTQKRLMPGSEFYGILANVN